MKEPKDLYEIQRELEAEAQDKGIEYFNAKVRKAKASGKESRTLYGVTLMKRSIDAVVTGLEEFLKDASTGKAGYRHTAAKLLSVVDLEKAAFVGLKFVMDGISQKHPLTKTAMAIAGALEDQHKWEQFKRANPLMFARILEEATEKTTNRYYRRYNINLESKKTLLEWEPWSKQEKCHLGCKIIDMIVQCGIVDVVTHTFGRNKRQLFIVPNERTLAWIEKVNERGQLLTPYYMPCVVEPKPWTDPWTGGYHTEHIKPFPFIKTHIRKAVDALEKLEMPNEYRAINALQGSVYRVNGFIVEMMELAWESGQPWAGIPPREPLPIPPCPFPTTLLKEEMTPEQMKVFKAWKHSASKTYQANAKMNSKRIQFLRTLHMAQKFTSYEEMFFVWNNDFRWRKYVVNPFLSPQGPDFAKALLEFGKGMPLGEEGVRWLAIHGANCYGVDKVTFDERVQWVNDNTDKILACALDPLAVNWWTEADSPWCFLAFCREWLGYCRDGESFESRIAVAQDGSNNGLQHLSALLRDSRGGMATNLIPSEKPQDIYSDVALVVVERLKERARNGDQMARQWLDFGVTRKCTKRPVMVVPYGGTIYSTRQYVEEYVVEMVESGVYDPWDGDYFNAANYLSEVVWGAISEVVVAARKVMDWLQEVGSLLSKAGKPVRWYTPSGAFVHQMYPEVSSRRITTYIDGTLIKPQIREQNYEKTDKRRAVNGVSPNFVHSLDAAAMTMTINRCLDEGITDFAMIHDSYGTHAANSGKLARILREAFVDIYKNQDPLQHFYDMAVEAGVTPPPIPERGDLDIEGVLDSLYFFA